MKKDYDEVANGLIHCGVNRLGNVGLPAYGASQEQRRKAADWMQTKLSSLQLGRNYLISRLREGGFLINNNPAARSGAYDEDILAAIEEWAGIPPTVFVIESIVEEPPIVETRRKEGGN
jgi:hypothetical protein